MTSEIPDFQVQEPPEKRPPCKKKDRNRMKLAVILKDLTDSNYKKVNPRNIYKAAGKCGNEMVRGKTCLSQPHQLPFCHYCHVYYHFLLISAVCTKEIECCNGKYNV